MSSSYQVVDPATGETVRTYPTISAAELEGALDRAHRASQDWPAVTGVAERAALVRRLGELHVKARDRLADTIVREMGKPISQARAEVEFAASIYHYYASNAAEMLADEPIALLEGEGSAVVRHSAYGVLLGIMPWNFPSYQVARFAAPNLAIGNAIVLKHAPQCPESAAAIAELVVEAGFPAGTYENVFASHEQIEQVIADPRVRGISVTGSDRAGAAVAEIAGRHLKKVVLELGGSDPFIILAARDLDAVVMAAVSCRLRNSGQACNAGKRFIVIDELYEAFLERFVAALRVVTPSDPQLPETTLGPLSSEAAAERLEWQVQGAVTEGARLVAGGRRDGTFFEPTVLTDLRPGNPARQEEFFGPVAQVYRVTDEREAVALANATPYGLGAYVMTDDDEQARRVADRVEAGMVFVNTIGPTGPELPFGGVKQSGFGKELGRLGAEEFVNKKLVRSGAS